MNWRRYQRWMEISLPDGRHHWVRQRLSSRQPYDELFSKRLKGRFALSSYMLHGRMFFKDTLMRTNTMARQKDTVAGGRPKSLDAFQAFSMSVYMELRTVI